jgi:hypothetical protein
LRVHVQAAGEALLEAKQAAREKNETHVAAAMQRFHKAYEAIQEAARRPVR